MKLSTEDVGQVTVVVLDIDILDAGNELLSCSRNHGGDGQPEAAADPSDSQHEAAAHPTDSQHT